MPENLKSVLITGGTDGLGHATSLLLAEQGYRVFAGGRNAEKRAALDTLARQKNLPLETIDMDVRDDASVDRAVSEIEREAGAVDVLVNGAGIAVMAAMEEISQADLHLQMETNFFGVVRVTQRVLPKMRERRLGRIINVSSVAGIRGYPLFGPYSSSKHALEAISDAWRLELRPFGIYLVVLQPGYIPSGMNRASVGLSSSYTKSVTTSPYAGLYQNFLGHWKKRTKAPKYQPIDFARVVLRALRDTPPKARYPVTSSAYLMRFLKRVLSDRMFDRQAIRAFGIDELRPGGTLSPAETKAALEEVARQGR